MVGSALLLSGPLGLGHEMPARSFTDVLAQAGWRVRSRDSMALLGDRGARAGQRVFDRLMTVPGVYDGLHFAQFRTGGRVARLAERLAARPAVPRLLAELERDPADLVLSVFATGALAAAELRARARIEGGPEFRAVVYCPDVAVHKLWVHEGTDLFLVSSPAAAASVRRFRPRAPIALVPPPVRAAFYEAPGRAAARLRLEVPADAPCALLMDSGWGFAPLPAAAAALADAGVHVLAVAGRNARAERELRDLAATRPLLRPFGFTGQVPALMAAADVVVALPGAATCAEARVVGRPLLLLDVMPGHGRDNLLHELERGAEACGPSAADIAASVTAMLDRQGLDGQRLDGQSLHGQSLHGQGPDGQGLASQGLDRQGLDGQRPDGGGFAGAGDPPGAPGAPRWEPAFAAALGAIGIDVPLGVTPAAKSTERNLRREQQDAHPLP